MIFAEPQSVILALSRRCVEAVELVASNPPDTADSIVFSDQLRATNRAVEHLDAQGALIGGLLLATADRPPMPATLPL
jgi:hypothetical protein